MNKRNTFILAVLIVASLAGAVYVLSGKPQVEKTIETDITREEEASVVSKTNMEEENEENKAEENVPSDKPSDVNEEIVKTEEISIVNNTPEYEMKAALYQKGSGETFLKLEYYSEGASTEKIIDDAVLPEIKSIFKNREDIKDNKNAFRLNQIFLNVKKQKIYFMVFGKPLGEEVNGALYSYSLKDFTLNKLFSQFGRFSELRFSKDMKYLAFSYLDSIASSVYQGKSLLQVLDCSTDKFKVNGSRDSKDLLIGNNSDSIHLFDYYTISWQSGSIIKLKEVTYAKSGAVGEKTREVLYDVEKNQLTNLDGSPALTAGSTGKQKEQQEQQVKADSDAVKALKNFYGFLSSGEFTKAYDVLDDKFQLNAFKLLGVTELSKKDIDVESFSVYGSLFKSARIESIVHEKPEAGLSTVYFYQLFTISEGNESRQALAAKLRKTPGGWKIVSVTDGNINEKPFKE